MSQRYNLYQDSNCMEDYKGVKVKRLQNVTREELMMKGTLSPNDLDGIMLACKHLETTVGIVSVEFDTQNGVGKRYLLEKA